MHKKILAVHFGAIFLVLFIPVAIAGQLHVGSGQMYATIQECVDAAQEGETCLVHEGTYSGAAFPRSGTPGNRITVLADTSGSQPIVTGNFAFGSQSYITVEGFAMQNRFVCDGCSFIEIKNNAVSHSGIGIGGSGDSTGGCNPAKGYLCGDDILIDGNTIAGITDDVFKPNGDRWVIRNNIAANIVAPDGVHLDFFQTSCLYPVSKADYALVENNLFADITGDSNAHFLLVNCANNDFVTNYIVRYNKVRNIGSFFMTMINMDPYASGATIYGNTIYKTHTSNRYTISLSGVLSSTAGTQNNLYYDAMDYASIYGAYRSPNCNGSLVYDPDGIVTLYSGGCLGGSIGVILNRDPDFENADANDFSLKSGSHAINKGYPLTHVAGTDSGSGITLIVDSAWYFQDGWAGVDPDVIAVGDLSNRVQIDSIDYDAGAITLTNAISRNSGDSIWLYKDSDGTVLIYDNAPDIGAVEYNLEAADTLAPTVSILSPSSYPTYTTTSATINLGGTASDDTGVVQVTWTNDRAGAGTATGTTSWSANGIALYSGTNILTVTAHDAGGNTNEDVLTVTSNPDPYPGDSASLPGDSSPGDSSSGCFISASYGGLWDDGY